MTHFMLVSPHGCTVSRSEDTLEVLHTEATNTAISAIREEVAVFGHEYLEFTVVCAVGDDRDTLLAVAEAIVYEGLNGIAPDEVRRQRVLAVRALADKTTPLDDATLETRFENVAEDVLRMARRTPGTVLVVGSAKILRAIHAYVSGHRGSSASLLAEMTTMPETGVLQFTLTRMEE